MHVFLLCFNEEILLPHTIAHYKKYLPNCKIIIYDNHSTDNSVKIAKEMGCRVVLWDSNNEINEFRYLTIKNHCWKILKEGWVIVADMDEWLCVTEKELAEEEKQNTSLLTIKGYNMIGESRRIDLSDICLDDIKKKVYNEEEDKTLCFYRPFVREMNYKPGAHKCHPILVKGGYSKKTFINKHMDYLGLPFIMQKILKRYERSQRMREKYQLANHYTDNMNEIKRRYFNYLYLSKI